MFSSRSPVSSLSQRRSSERWSPPSATCPSQALRSPLKRGRDLTCTLVGTQTADREPDDAPQPPIYRNFGGQAYKMAQRNILVADDDASIRSLLKQLLADEGY